MADFQSILEDKHESEMQALEQEIKAMIKSASKGKKLETETKGIQMIYDLKAKHIEEMAALEQHGASTELLLTIESMNDSKLIHNENLANIEENFMNASVESKKAKSKKKKDRKEMKELDKVKQREVIDANSGPSLRDIEITSLNVMLKKDNLKIKDIASDGNCLYRAIAHQLISHNNDNSIDYVYVRNLAATYLRSHFDDFSPLICSMQSDDQNRVEYEAYCESVESQSAGVWGGQLEISAISDSLQTAIWIYDANSAVIKMGDQYALGDKNIIKLVYHRHYYALGEHYNSVENI